MSEDLTKAIRHLRAVRGDEEDGYDPEFLRGYDDAVECLERLAEHMARRTPDSTP